MSGYTSKANVKTQLSTFHPALVRTVVINLSTKYLTEKYQNDNS